jgi:uncharacterized protein (TIGR02594 family)
MNGNRRRVLSTTVGLLVLLVGRRPSAAGSAYLPRGIGVEPDFNGRVPPVSDSLGVDPALPVEERMARTLLFAVPEKTSPLAVAEYFIDVGNGQAGDEYKPFICGWPTRWNPVIRTFFQATKTQPAGDVTPWCAAFVNWCFMHSGQGVATDSASSGSFRCFGAETSSPKRGDLVVFKDKADAPDANCSGRGHVGFYIDDFGADIDVLGGNQIAQHSQSHRISVARLAKDGRRLALHSFRTYQPSAV